MITRRQTGIVLLAVLAALLAWEAATVGWGDDATISRVVWGLTGSPLFTLACGVVLGHWFWQASRCRLCGGRHPAAPTAEDRAAFEARWVARVERGGVITGGLTFVADGKPEAIIPLGKLSDQAMVDLDASLDFSEVDKRIAEKLAEARRILAAQWPPKDGSR